MSSIFCFGLNLLGAKYEIRLQNSDKSLKIYFRVVGSISLGKMVLSLVEL